MVTPRTKEMLDLVKLDYDQTSEFVRGVLATALAIRGWGITIVVALAGFSLDQDQPLLSALGAVVTVVFCLVDVYHFALYRRALRHVRSLERLYSDYYGALSRAEFDEEALHEFLIDLETHQFGFYRQLGPFSVKEIRQAPAIVAMYVVLLVASFALVVLEATTKVG